MTTWFQRRPVWAIHDRANGMLLGPEWFGPYETAGAYGGCKVAVFKTRREARVALKDVRKFRDKTEVVRVQLKAVEVD